MAKILGSGKNQAAIYSRGGTQQLLPLAKVSNLEWGRNRNAFSVATVTVTRDDDNYHELGKVHPWAHELVIFRDGQRVWEGPIRVPRFRRGESTFEAVDVLGWLNRRRIRIKRTRKEGNESPATSEMLLTLQRAFATGDPNVLEFVDVRHHALETKVARDVKANSGMYAGDFTGLAGQGANFTTIGRRVVIWPDEVLIGRVDTFIPEQHSNADPEVYVSGDDLATNVAAVNSNGGARVSVAGSTDVDPSTYVSDFYGRHDRIVSVEGKAKAATLNAVGRAAVAELFPAPELINLSGDAQLYPTAPFRIDELVPGVLVPVETNATPRRASGTFLLDSVKVTHTSAGEAVSIAVANASAYAGSAEA